jgi:deoxynucleoside triphosphate triphosphohydrolase SAMHD1
VPSPFKESLEAWGAQLLEPYRIQLDQLPSPATTKEFNDPVWGTILVRPAEVMLLDSPLLQRLRMIAQLGMVHFVYPAARHSRFEHTLGVVHQVSRLIASLNEHYTGRGGEVVSTQERNLLRLTALCHDIGHGALSHVSENALKTFDSVQDITLEFADREQMEHVPLAEIASYYLVGSPAFSELLDQILALVPDHGLPPCEQTIAMMQRAIIGKPICDKVPLLHELISGPFDADKLDYMTRDAQMTGVPVVTDIPRLVQKVRAVEVARDDLRPEIAATIAASEASYLITGIELSGGRSVDELILARTLQEDKLYRHHKVRAIEAMVASLYHQLAALAPDAVPMLAYRLRDSDFTGLDRERIAEVIERPLAGNDNDSVAVAIDLAARLGRRELFVRAYAFSLGMPLDPYRADVDHYAGLERLVRESGGDFEQRGRLIDLVVEELRAALALLAPELLERYPDLKPYIWLDPLYSAPDVNANDSARAYLISQQSGTKSVMRFQDDYAESVRWANAYILTRDAGYVFAPADLAQYTYVAMEKVLRRDYHIRTPHTMQLYSKRPAKDLEALKRKLDEHCYYQGIAYDVRPLPERLTRADITKRIERVCERLSGYEGPVRGGAVAKRRSLLSPERVAAWLRQFPGELEDQPLEMLEEIHLVGRADVVAALDALLQSDTGTAFVGAAVCPLGQPKDSSAVTTYWAGDGQQARGLDVLSLGDALLTADRPVVFVEDFIGSGQQSISILEAWLGADPTTELGERREQLSDAAARQLRERKLAFVFASGQRLGLDALRARTVALGLDAEVLLASESAPRAFAGAAGEARARLADFCQRVGYELLLDSGAGHDEAWARERALGYGNNAFLVLFGYNTPTQTLTCLWKDGMFEEVPWMALFPRRSKR